MSIVSASSDKAEGSQAGGRATPLVVLGNRRQSSTYKTQGEPWRRASLAAINTVSQTVLAGRHMWGGAQNDRASVELGRGVEPQEGLDGSSGLEVTAAQGRSKREPLLITSDGTNAPLIHHPVKSDGC